MLKVAASVALIISLAACSGPPKPGRAEYALQQHEFQAEKTKTAADQAPDWYINPPKTEGYIYAAGTAGLLCAATAARLLRAAPPRSSHDGFDAQAETHSAGRLLSWWCN